MALAREGRVVAMKENDEGLNHSTLLGVYVDEVLRQAGVMMAGVDAVAVSAGPGSYTGLRIGVSLAKGLCYGAGKPLIAVGTLESMADAVADRVREDALYCPMIDARRMEVYAAVYDREGREVTGYVRWCWMRVPLLMSCPGDRCISSGMGAGRLGVCWRTRTRVSCRE